MPQQILVTADAFQQVHRQMIDKTLQVRSGSFQRILGFPAQDIDSDIFLEGIEIPETRFDIAADKAPTLERQESNSRDKV